MWPFSYFERKRKEDREKIKAELRDEILSEARKTLGELVQSASKDAENARAKFLKEVDDRKKGVDAKVDKLMHEVRGFNQNVERRTEEQYNMTKDAVERAKNAADSASASATSAKETAGKVGDISALVQKAEGAISSIELRLKGAVAEFSLNAGKVLGDESNKLQAQAASVLAKAIGEAKADYQSKYDAFVKDLNDEFAKLSSAHSSRLDELKKMFDSFSVVENRVLEIFTYMKENLPHIAYVVCMPEYQRQLLRELDDVYKGDSKKMRRVLQANADELQRKRSATTADLLIMTGPRALDELMAYQENNRDVNGRPISLVKIYKTVYNWGKRA